MRFVELFQLCVAQVRNMGWLATTVVVVGSAGEQVAAHGLPEAGNG